MKATMLESGTGYSLVEFPVAHRAEVNAFNSGEFGRFVFGMAVGAIHIACRIIEIPGFFNQRLAKLCVLFLLMAAVQCFNAAAGNTETPAGNESGYNSGAKSLPVAVKISVPKFRDHSVYWFLCGLSIGSSVAFLYYNHKISKNKVTAKRPTP